MKRLILEERILRNAVKFLVRYEKGRKKALKRLAASPEVMPQKIVVSRKTTGVLP
jgi:hypothetical protein